MNNQFGVSFQPGQPQAGGSGGRGGGSSLPPLQTAIKLLSLRLPTTAAPGGIAPQALLQSQGGAGMPGGGATNPNADVLAFLRRLMMGQGGFGGDDERPASADWPQGHASGFQTDGGGPAPQRDYMPLGLPRIIAGDNQGTEPDPGSGAAPWRDDQNYINRV